METLTPRKEIESALSPEFKSNLASPQIRELKDEPIVPQTFPDPTELYRKENKEQSNERLKKVSSEHELSIAGVEAPEPRANLEI